MMRRLHLGVIAFLVTDLSHEHLRGMDDARRLLFRSTHLYLLFTSLLSLADLARRPSRSCT
jgi:hypothetical protein